MSNNLKLFIETAKQRNDEKDIHMVYDMADKVHITYLLNGITFRNELITGYMTAISGSVRGKNKVILIIKNSEGRVVKIPVEDIIEINE